MRIAPPSLSFHHSSPATRDFQSSISVEAVSYGYAGPLSPTAPVLCHGPALWSPPSGSGGGDSPTHAPLQLTSPSSPSRRYPDVSSVSSRVSVWSPRSRPGRSCRGYNIPHWIAYQEVMYPLGKQSNVVYRIPCSCGQVYIGETTRSTGRRPQCWTMAEDRSCR